MSDQSKIISVLVINPHNRTIYQKEITSDLQSFYKEIGCRSIDAVRIDKDDAIYIDDEDLLTDPSKQAYFAISDYSQPLAGIGVVVGTDAMGNTISTKHNIFEIGEKVRFLTLTSQETNQDEGEVLYTFV